MNVFEQLEREIEGIRSSSSWLLSEELPKEVLGGVLEFLNPAFLPSEKNQTPAALSKPETLSQFRPLYNESPNMPAPKSEPPPVSLPIGEAKNLDSLRLRINGCQKCPLCQRRRNIVFGQGNPDARILFIGEGPGEEEDIQGLAFVGRAGRLLTQLILSIGLNRQDVFITNMVKCKPPGNRNPEAYEVLKCSPILRRQMELIRPKLIIALGGVAAKGLLNTKAGITSLRGTIHDYRGIPLVAIYHPSFLLRNPAQFTEMWKDLTWIKDKVLPEKLG